jgi:L-asparaginase/Glu-tRNA(Gln) amidotransferase subunit D
MWTYDRYLRWMDQMTDWVRPAPDAVPYKTGGAPKTGASNLASVPKPAAKPARAPTATSEDVIEIPSDEIDLTQLAELAKKVVERKPS